MEEEKKNNRRQIAHKMSIKQALEGSYVKNSDWNPNFIVSESEEKISRINIVGVVIASESEVLGETLYETATLDDSTGRIKIRSFESANALSALHVGDIILVIGKPAEYASERYIRPEIIKKLNDSRWLEHRKLEIALQEKIRQAAPKAKKEESKISAGESTGGQNEEMTKNEAVYSIIKKLDSGAGADYSEIVKNAAFKEADAVIRKLLENGDIFEIKPGKLKIL
jgi:RPA family protein